MFVHLTPVPQWARQAPVAFGHSGPQAKVKTGRFLNTGKNCLLSKFQYADYD